MFYARKLILNNKVAFELMLLSIVHNTSKVMEDNEPDTIKSLKCNSDVKRIDRISFMIQ